jgi:hypothetical protein
MSAQPMRTFEELRPHEKRVLEEAQELAQKCTRLAFFISENRIFLTLGRAEKSLLRRQLSAMHEYEKILLQRIDNFRKNK